VPVRPSRQRSSRPTDRRPAAGPDAAVRPRSAIGAAASARFLAEAAHILGESLDFETTLRRVAELAVPSIADWCAIELLTDEGTLEELALVHRDAAKLALVGDLRRRYPPDPASRRGSWEVIRTGAPVLVGRVTPEMIDRIAVDETQAGMIHELDLRSYMCLPLRESGRVLGSLTLATDGSGRLFEPEDLAFAGDLAARAARAIQNARSFRSADRSRIILDAIGEGVLVIDHADGRIRDANRGALELLGMDRSGVLGRSLWSLVTNLTERAARRLVGSLDDGGVDARTVGLELRRSDGTSVPVEVQLKRIDLPDEPGAIVAIARDIRERVDTRARLERLADAEHARAAELRAVIRAMGDGVVVCAADGGIILANPAAQSLFPEVDERSYAEILGELRDPDGRAPVLGRIGGPVVLPTRRPPERWIEVATYAVGAQRSGRVATGRGGETIVVLRDVTVARQREAVRETFIGVLSHELRTPVTTIYGGARVLARPDSSLDETTRRTVLDDIVAESERLKRLVEDVVALNRFGEGSGELGREPVLLQRLVPPVVTSEEVRWPGVAFDVRMPPSLPTVVADPTYVEQVVRNLLSNAAKYGGGSGVEIVLEAADDEVAVRILDDGPGIEAGEVDRLFELFYRSPSTAARASGAGIGLFVCARLVQAMGGHIWARPRPAGGAEFGFALRIMAEA
jgi:PAS domain S-box-containing protein